jgi:hypothetical protein
MFIPARGIHDDVESIDLPNCLWNVTILVLSGVVPSVRREGPADFPPSTCCEAKHTTSDGPWSVQYSGMNLLKYSFFQDQWGLHYFT